MFNVKYPQVQIEFTIWPWEVARAKLLAANEANNLPDAGRNQYITDLAPLGAIVELDDLLTEEEKKDNARRMPYSWSDIFNPEPDGKEHLYGIPYFIGNKAILVNKTMFEKKGIKLADLSKWTWDDFTRLANSLRNRTAGSMPWMLPASVTRKRTSCSPYARLAVAW